jgi:hypothetical protein
MDEYDLHRQIMELIRGDKSTKVVLMENFLEIDYYVIANDPNDNEDESAKRFDRALYESRIYFNILNTIANAVDVTYWGKIWFRKSYDSDDTQDLWAHISIPVSVIGKAPEPVLATETIEESES